jgi:NTP pyrophosphatase (non-canonical NTP hydrolase)
MTNDEYMYFVLTMENKDMVGIRARMETDTAIRMLHAASGICSEGGEIMDEIKKHIFTGVPLNRTKVIEELGDLQFFVVLLTSVMGLTIDDIMKTNQGKLKVRYRDKFSEESCKNRDTEKEIKTINDLMLSDKK